MSSRDYHKRKMITSLKTCVSFVKEKRTRISLSFHSNYKIAYKPAVCEEHRHVTSIFSVLNYTVNYRFPTLCLQSTLVINSVTTSELLFSLLTYP